MAGEDPKYIARVKALPCACCGIEDGINAHHETGAGMGKRAHDHRTAPLCGSGTTGCHGSFHNVAMVGPFHRWVKAELREWQRTTIEETQQRLGL